MQHRSYLIAALAGVLLGFAANSTEAADLFNNTNTLPVDKCTQPVVNCSPKFQLTSPATIDAIQTYHQQSGPAASKTLALRDVATGAVVVGPLPVTTQPASPGFENWIATVGSQQLPAGIYIVIDTQADMWMQNNTSCDGPGVAGSACHKGFAIVRGSPVSSPTGSCCAAPSITDCTATCTVPPATTSPPTFACSAHGPHSTCKRMPASGDNPGGGVTCTDGINTTTCNCMTGCTTH